MIRSFDKSWRDWIDLNIERGCNREEMAKILIDHGFAPKLIEATLGVLPKDAGQTKSETGGGIPPDEKPAAEQSARTEPEPAAHGIQLPNAAVQDTEGKLDLWLLENFLDDEDGCDSSRQSGRTFERQRPRTTQASSRVSEPANPVTLPYLMIHSSAKSSAGSVQRSA